MPKIMLIEDDATMLSLLETLLNIEGYQVATQSYCDSIEGVVNNLRQEDPELIFLDVHLRQMNGLDLLREVRRDPELQSIKILMTSGMDVAARCQEAGADDFILKPFMPDELIRKIHEALGATE